MKSDRDSTWIGLAWVSPWIIGFLCFMLGPLALSLYYSFTDFSVLEKPVWIGAENYRALWSDPVIWESLRNTLVYAAVSIPLSAVVALGLGAVLHGLERLGGWSGRMAGLARAMIFVPTLIPVAAAAMVFLYLFNTDVGLINGLLGVVGLPRPDWLGSPAFAMPAVVLMGLWSVGQGVLIYQAALGEVPRSLYEAASIDGLSAVRRVWHVTLPMISPVILFSVVMSIIASWQVFAVPYIMTKGGPGRSTYFSTMYLYDNAFVYGPKMGYASALAWVQAALIVVMTAVTFGVARRVVFYRGAPR